MTPSEELRSIADGMRSMADRGVSQTPPDLRSLAERLDRIAHEARKKEKMIEYILANAAEEEQLQRAVNGAPVATPVPVSEPDNVVFLAFWGGKAP